MGCLPFTKKKIQKFRLKVKWNSNFPESPFRNCKLSPQVVRLFRSEQAAGISLLFASFSSFQSLISWKQYYYEKSNCKQ